jgi:hypothetical protein
LVIVQSRGTERHLAWDGDVVAYLEMMSRYSLVSHTFGRATRSVLVALEGGNVVRQEIVLAARRGFPVVLAQGYGRAADDIADDLLHGRSITCRVNGEQLAVPDGNMQYIRVVEAGNAPQLAAALQENCL